MLTALYFFVYRLLKLIWIVLSILFIPFSILYAILSRDLNGVIPYSRYIIHSRLNRLRTFSFTIRLTIDNGTPKVNLQHYDDDTADATMRINETKFPSIRACIMRSFLETRRYSFVILQTDSASSKFIQLRMDTGIYLVDLPLTPLTLNRDHAIDFIKLLRAQGFKKTQPGTIYLNKMYSIYEERPELTIIQANLGRDMETAAAFCSTVFTKLFKTTAIPEVIVG
jgi:hypothetical protein